MAHKIFVHDVGMRDGLQVEKEVVPTDLKILWIEKLLSSGVDIIQVGSFVHPEKVPQMADTDRLFKHFSRQGNRLGQAILSGLVLNEKGLDRAMGCGVEQICVGVSASDTHSRRNTGMGTDEAARRIIAIAQKAAAAGKAVQISVQSAFGCGFEGPIPEERVLDLVRRFLGAGLKTISLADTAGHAFPLQVERLFAAIRELEPTVECVCHFHDTYGLAMANACAAMRTGVRYYESAFGGLGGCPFTAVAAGNLCTEDFVHLLHRMGERKDISLEALVSLAAEAGRNFQRQLPGTIHRTGPIPGARADAEVAPS